MTRTLDAALWPLARVGDALAQLARAARLAAHPQAPDRLPAAALADAAALDAWLAATAQAAALEISPTRLRVGQLADALHDDPPLLAIVPRAGVAHLAAVVRARGAHATLVAPDGALVRVPLADLEDAVRGAYDPRTLARVDALLARANVRESRRPLARDALAKDLVGKQTRDVGWTLALAPNAPFLRQLRRARVPGALAGVALLQLAQQALSIAGWWLVGKGALEGRLEPAWLAAWGLVLATAILPRLGAQWLQGVATLRFAVLLKRRLLHGALRLEPEETRTEGAGELLARVMEADSVEGLVTSGGLSSALSVLDLASAASVLAVSGGGRLAALVLLAWTALTASLAWRYGRRLRAWTHDRLAMTQDLAERMIGHRTRLVQEPRERWHDGEDERLAGYAEGSRAMDATSALLQGVLPRGWLVAGALAIAPAFVGGAASGAELGVLVGGLLLAYQAIGRFAGSATALMEAHVAWQKARLLFDAGARVERPGAAAWSSLPCARGEATLEARDVRFRYAGRADPVLRGVTLKIAPRERVLLEGPSGGGKSTLGAVLAGLRAPDAGMLLLGGLDPQTLGEAGWRRRIVAAPQFHENHVVSATLAFNLLMGRGWPARDADLREAAEVCRELGLGPLLERMPSGLMQMVGETGWQLSHGEKSRLFIARAVLQRPDLIVLDESFAALDPETLDRAMRYVVSRAPGLLVIAHP